MYASPWSRQVQACDTTCPVFRLSQKTEKLAGATRGKPPPQVGSTGQNVPRRLHRIKRFPSTALWTHPLRWYPTLSHPSTVTRRVGDVRSKAPEGTGLRFRPEGTLQTAEPNSPGLRAQRRAPEAHCEDDWTVTPAIGHRIARDGRRSEERDKIRSMNSICLDFFRCFHSF